MVLLFRAVSGKNVVRLHTVYEFVIVKTRSHVIILLAVILRGEIEEIGGNKALTLVREVGSRSLEN